MEWHTTSTVLARLGASEHESAWDLFVGTFRGTLVRFAERIGLSRSDAQDAAQETLLAFLEGYRRGRFDSSKGHLKGWLFGIARRQVLALRRRRQGEEPAHSGAQSSQPIEEVAARDGSTEVWEDEWRRTVFSRALERVRGEVSPRTFEVFRAVVFDELDTDQVCERFSIPRTKVYNIKHRVSRRLGELVQELDDA